MISALDALLRLRDGNRRFTARQVDTQSMARRVHEAGISDGQHPFAIILACSDSRVPTELIFDQGIGDLFVIRVAGNVVATTQIGSIEFAAKQFGTKLVVVLGHSNCGAVIATLKELALKESQSSPNLRAIIDRIRPIVEPILETRKDDEDHGVIRDSVLANVHASVEKLSHGSLILERLIENGELRITGAVYSIETGLVEFFDENEL